MAIKAVVDCPSCGFPISAEYEGQTKVCRACGEHLEAMAQDVSIPTPVFVGIIAFGLGIILGPALIASTKGGAEWLEKQARERLR